MLDVLLADFLNISVVILDLESLLNCAACAVPNVSMVDLGIAKIPNELVRVRVYKFLNSLAKVRPAFFLVHLQDFLVRLNVFVQLPVYLIFQHYFISETVIWVKVYIPVNLKFFELTLFF